MQTLDWIFAGVNALTAADELSASDRSAEDNLILTSSILWTVIHISSAATGHAWAGDCERAVSEYEDAPTETAPRQVMPVTTEPIEVPAPAPEPEAKRTIKHGSRPVFCAAQKANAEAGACFLEINDCNAARVKAPDDFEECAPHLAASCFNANKTLDDVRVTMCSVTVKACEVERGKLSHDPDFTNVTSACGVYRADAKPAQAEDDE